MFKPLTTGLFNPMAVNRKLREIWEAIEQLQEVNGLKEAEPVQDTDTFTVDGGETIEIEAKPVEWDWRTTDDANALKEWALSEHGLEIKGNKKADTIRKEIEGFLSTED